MGTATVWRCHATQNGATTLKAESSNSSITPQTVRLVLFIMEDESSPASELLQIHLSVYMVGQDRKCHCGFAEDLMKESQSCIW